MEAKRTSSADHLCYKRRAGILLAWGAAIALMVCSPVLALRLSSKNSLTLDKDIASSHIHTSDVENLDIENSDILQKDDSSYVTKSMKDVHGEEIEFGNGGWPVGRMIRVTGQSVPVDKLVLTVYPKQPEAASSSVISRSIFQVSIDMKEGICSRASWDKADSKPRIEKDGEFPFKAKEEPFMLVLLRTKEGYQVDAYGYNHNLKESFDKIHKVNPWTRVSYHIVPNSGEQEPSRIMLRPADVLLKKFSVSSDVELSKLKADVSH